MVTGFVPQLAAKLASLGTCAADATEAPMSGVPVIATTVVVVIAMAAAITPAKADERLNGTDGSLVNWSRTFNILSSSSVRSADATSASDSNVGLHSRQGGFGPLR